MLVDFATARALAQDLLAAAGVPHTAAALQTDLLLDAQAKGVPSHGLLRLPRLLRRIANGRANPTADGEHRWTTPTFLTVDGQQGLGPVVAWRALQAVVPAAEREGIACAAVTSANHLGMLGFYTSRIAALGMVCLATTSSEPLVHPWGGTRAVVGTNPLSIAVPAEPEPLVLDMATSEVSMGKIHEYALRGEPLEPGWAIDAEGSPTLDADAARTGALTPFGGPKGYGLGLALGAMIAFVTGSAVDPDVRGTLDDTELANKGDLFVVIKGAGRSVSGLLDVVRDTPRSNPSAPVLVPGDRARSRAQRSRERGLDVADGLWAELLRLREQRGQHVAE